MMGRSAESCKMAAEHVLFLALLSMMMMISMSKAQIDTATAPAISSSDDGLRTYIVQMSKLEKPSTFATHRSWYFSTFSAAVADDEDDDAEKAMRVSKSVNERVLHTYDNVFWGFAARLMAAEVTALESQPGVLRVHPEGVRHPHTTHTPEFLGLNSSAGIMSEADGGDDVIIGVLDTGVWPERDAFLDNKIGRIPSKWKGSCVQEASFDASLCNKKLIGAKYFVEGYEAASGPVNTSVEFRSPRDGEGHGTHTASTAGGRRVYHANLLGFASGVAQGMAPKARLAIYKVCWMSGCYDSDILAAFDEAVADGVDVISLSVGGNVVPYFLDPIAIGAFGATKKGVFVSCSAGNSGPSPLTVTNVAPWITTVAASTVDRNFPALVKIGNGETFPGVSLYGGRGLGTELLPLIYAANASISGLNPSLAALCLDGSLDPDKVKGKIVLCDRGTNARVAKGGVCKAAGAVGMILRNLPLDAEGLIADAHVLPATAVGAKAGARILNYLWSTIPSDDDSNAVGHALILFGGTVFGTKPAPVVSSFSSRGPNPETPQILKPDITGPGVNILAAWTGNAGPTGLAMDERRVDYNIISGTSMSCPHISGVAALLMGARSQWSPAAIKSAMMTSAYVYDNSGSLIQDEATGNVTNAFSYGAGHVAPQKALDPGLIYELDTSDYVAFFCSLNYTDGAIRLLDPEITACPNKTTGKRKFAIGDLNYPSFSAVFDQTVYDSAVLETSFQRTLTNVGPVESTYSVTWEVPEGVKIVVDPPELKFSVKDKKKKYTVKIVTSPVVLSPGTIKSAFGFLAWTDGSHFVQSPLVINWLESFPSFM